MRYGNGAIFVAGAFSEGVKDGPWCYFFEKGELFMVGSYKKGVCHGRWVVFDRNGSPYAEGNGPLTCDGQALSFQLAALNLVNWTLLDSDLDTARHLLPTLENGWEGAGIYKDGLFIGP